MLKSFVTSRNLKSFLLFCFLMLEAISYASKFTIKTNNAKQITTKLIIAKFIIAKFVVAKLIIAKLIIAKLIIAKHTMQKSFTIIV